MTELRLTTLLLLDEAQAAGCRLSSACSEIELDPRTVQRWRKQRNGGEDRRKGPRSAPQQKLTDEEKATVVDTANAPEFRNLSPKQIVPRLADRGQYVASESTFYRVLRAEGLMAHRGPSKPRTVQRPEELVATGPNKVWSWDITYLPAPVRGTFFYLYLFVDVWSRRIMKAVVLAEESTEHAARLLYEACAEHDVQPHVLTLHSDNGSPMKGSPMLATMQSRGVVSSFSRPSVSNDNPYSEALFRTLKYVPSYPRKPFESIDAAWAWVERFVDWYNREHRHSAIGFVAPDERHRGNDVRVLLARRDVYAAARRRHPARWSRHPRNWNAPATVALNLRDRQASARATEALRIGATPATSMVPTPASTSSLSPLRTTPNRHHTRELQAASILTLTVPDGTVGGRLLAYMDACPEDSLCDGADDRWHTVAIVIATRRFEHRDSLLRSACSGRCRCYRHRALRSTPQMGGRTRRQLPWHDLRHAGITWRAVRGDPPLQTQRAPVYTGHDDLRTTQKYINEAQTFEGASFGQPFPAVPLAAFSIFGSNTVSDTQYSPAGAVFPEQDQRPQGDSTNAVRSAAKYSVGEAPRMA